MRQLWLASSSPRRKELLNQIGVNFAVLESVSIDESQLPSETSLAYVERLARQKAQAGLQLKPNDLVLGADTCVQLEQHILGKPSDKADAIATLLALSGRQHQVLTAVALVSAEQSLVRCVTTQVWFRRLNLAEIEAYWQTGEPKDKAGAYGIQGFGGVFVERIEGSYSAVVGLPIMETAAMLSQFDLPIWSRK